MLDELLRMVTNRSWVAEVFMIVFGTAIVRYVAKVVLDRLAAKFEQTRNLYDDALLEAVRRPLGLGIWVIGVSWAAEVVGGNAQAEIFDQVDAARDVAVVWILVWFAVRFIRSVEAHIIGGGYDDKGVDQTTVSAVGKLLRATAIITGALMAMQTLGFSVSGVLALGGIGGLAIGFAAQDLLANFFGGLMILLDRPFVVGDWIRSSEKDIEGTVEEIGWRLTRIRTFDQRPLYVPNSVFTSLTVENPSRMFNRRIKETIGVRYDDIDVLPQIVADVETLLKEHPEIDQSRTLMVNFLTFGASSLDFFIYTFTKTTVWADFHVIKQDVLFKIADIIAAHGAEIAFPTQTLLVAPASAGEQP